MPQCRSATMHNGRSPNLRHVSRTLRVNLDWLFERISLDPSIRLRFVRTSDQFGHVLTKGTYSAQHWSHSLCLWQIQSSTQRIRSATWSITAVLFFDRLCNLCFSNHGFELQCRRFECIELQGTGCESPLFMWRWSFGDSYSGLAGPLSWNSLRMLISMMKQAK